MEKHKYHPSDELWKAAGYSLPFLPCGRPCLASFLAGVAFSPSGKLPDPVTHKGKDAKI